jgi:5-methylcytosine-specific restriction endonuclease McrA
MSKYSEFQKWLMLQIRRISYRTRERNEAKARARIKRGKYKCAICEETFGPKQIQLDHKEPVIEPTRGFVSWDEYIKRLFVPASAYQVLCRSCHSKKSVAENKERRKEPERQEVKLVTCRTCGWVHFEVTRAFAEKEVEAFNKFYDALSLQKQEEYYGNHKVSIKDYESCGFCGGLYKNFRKTKKGECPTGCTIGPIIRKGD